MSETQTHELLDGTQIEISRDGRHKYWIDGNDQAKVPSVTSMLGHIDGDSFGVGQGWALKQVRLNDGDLEAPRRAMKRAMEDGNKMHEGIDNYILHDTIDEENELFIHWLFQIGEARNWLTSERFVYNKKLGYGGTIDAISTEAGGKLALWDWKTKDSQTYLKYGGSKKDHAQAAAYAMALNEMNSSIQVDECYIGYVFRDCSGLDVVKVDMEWATELFLASRQIYKLVGNANG